MNWHVPSPEEMAQCERLLQKFLSSHLQALGKFANGEDEEMTKERLKRHLMVVESLMEGAASVLPFSTSSTSSAAKDVNLYRTSVPFKRSVRDPIQLKKFWLEYWLEKSLEFWLDIHYTIKMFKNE